MPRPPLPTALLVGLLVATVLVPGLGCRTPRADTALPDTLASSDVSLANGPRTGASTLGTGDLIEVRVFQEPDASGAFRLSPEGTIDFPLCGKVKLAGKTSSEASDLITTCLGTRFIRNPQVSVLIREYTSKKVFVFGEVSRPGTFPFDENMSIIQAITLAGGFTKVASKNATNVTRLIDGKEQKIRVPVEDIGTGREKNFLLQPGDIVFVPESLF